MVETKLTCTEKIRDQIDTNEKLRTILKYSVKNRDQLYNLSNKHYYIFWKSNRWIACILYS